MGTEVGGKLSMCVVCSPAGSYMWVGQSAGWRKLAACFHVWKFLKLFGFNDFITDLVVWKWIVRGSIVYVVYINGVFVWEQFFFLIFSIFPSTWNWYFKCLCLADESDLLSMSTHHYRKRFEPKLGLIVLTCAKHFGSCYLLNTSYLKEWLFSGWFCASMFTRPNCK